MITLQIYLAVGSALLSLGAGPWKRLGWPMPRWADLGILVLTAVAILALAASGVHFLWQSYFGSHEGDPAQSRISPISGHLNLRNYHSGDPISVAINYEVGDTEVQNECGYARLVASRDELSHAALDNRFRRLVADLDIKSELDHCATKPPHSRDTLKAFAWDFVSDSELDSVKVAGGYLYVIGIWRYSIPGSSATYVQKYCRYLFGSFDNWNECGGPFNDTTVHIPK